MSEPQNYLTISLPKLQKLGEDVLFRNAQVRGGKVVFQFSS